MSEKNTGGPAFPGPDQMEQRENIHEGMALRDYFAAKAMHAALMTCQGAESEEAAIEGSARMAYMVADAMLRARGAE